MRRTLAHLPQTRPLTVRQRPPRKRGASLKTPAPPAPDTLPEHRVGWLGLS